MSSMSALSQAKVFTPSPYVSVSLTERVKVYWTRRAIMHRKTLKKEIADNRPWYSYIKGLISNHIPHGNPLHVLDVGTGTGFLAGIMAAAGHKATGVDLVPSMLQQAKLLAKSQQWDVNFLEMNAQQLDFEDASFDVVLSRNLTWTLPEPEDAYREWQRVLRPGGVFINFDAEYGTVSFSSQSREESLKDTYRDYSCDMLEECDAIKDSLNISAVSRPDWDVAVLQGLGFQSVSVDTAISPLFYRESDAYFNPVPMFCLSALK